MNCIRKQLIIAAMLAFAGVVFAQQPSAAPSGGDSAASGHTTVRGCLQGDRANYILVEDGTGSVYVLKGVGSKLNDDLRHEVEVKGKILPGTVKTGVRPEKNGSNPADTVHGVDGVPFQVENIKTDVRVISKHCQAADQQ